MASRRSTAAVLASELGLFAADAERETLVRKDLLVLGTGEPPALIRDIFRPRTAAVAPTVRKPAGAAPADPVVPPPETPPAFTLSISYLGSIKAGGRTIGLVLRGGQTLDVAEGDTISPGYKVVSVTAEAIVVRVLPEKANVCEARRPATKKPP
jgi:hypothetical protein